MSNIKKDLQLLAYAKTGLLKRLQHSINIGANVDSSDHFGRSALLLSLVYGHLDAARLLIASGAYLDERFFSQGIGIHLRFTTDCPPPSTKISRTLGWVSVVNPLDLLDPPYNFFIQDFIFMI